MFHGLYFTASVAAGVRPPSGFEGFVICPSGSIKDLKGSFSSFGGDQGKLKKVVSICEGTLAGTDGNSISDSCLVCWGYSYGFIQELPAFKSISSAEIGILIYEYGEIGSLADKFVVIHLLGEGFEQQFDFMLECRVADKGACGSKRDKRYNSTGLLSDK
jgi:hypothetical protein